jgi:hypothetical protein
MGASFTFCPGLSHELEHGLVRPILDDGLLIAKVIRRPPAVRARPRRQQPTGTVSRDKTGDFSVFCPSRLGLLDDRFHSDAIASTEHAQRGERHQQCLRRGQCGGCGYRQIVEQSKDARAVHERR